MNQSRRRWLQHTGALCATGLLGAWPAIAMGTRATAGTFGPLGPPDAHGVRLPAGFKARLLAITGQLVPGTDYRWHDAPDGGATFPTPDRGWVYVSNAEIPDHQGGVGALRFDSHGEIVAGYSLLTGTTRNCAGGATPWSTWLSCEEADEGMVYECDPRQPGHGVARPSLGMRWHEAAAVDPGTGYVYLTEDDPASRLYRFRPLAYGKLDTGILEAARIAPDGAVSWVRVVSDAPYRGDDSTAFARGEGAWYADGVIYFTTTADHRVWAYSLHTSHLEVVYDAVALGDDAILRDPDNLTVHVQTGALFVAEDAGEVQLVMLAPNHGRWRAAPIVQFQGHDDSEVTGPAFSPDGTRLYVSSQRGRDGEHGMTFEITGPFLDT